MKRRLARILLCAAEAVLLAVLVVCTTYTLRPYTRLCGFYGLKRDSTDVVFVGTSVTFSAFMPMEAWKDYGIPAYDYCTHMQFENALRYSLRDVERTQKPKVIMLDVAPFLYEHYAGNPSMSEADRDMYISFNLDSRNYTLDRFSLVYEINEDIHGSVSDYCMNFLDLSRSHLFQNPDFGRIGNAEKDAARGYFYMSRNGDRAFTPADTVPDDGSVTPLEGREQEYLDLLLEAAGKAEAEVVFFCEPVYFWETRQVGKKNYLKAYIEGKGFTFADFSGEIESIGLDYRTDFWSVNHFDSLGAVKVTKFLCEYLKKNYELPDRRGDPAYRELDEDYTVWEEMKNGWIEADSAAGG